MLEMATLRRDSEVEAIIEMSEKQIEALGFTEHSRRHAGIVSKWSGEILRALGKDEKAIAIGGGTYARALKCGCGFGPELPDEEATIHQPNEYITFDRIRMMSEIYYDALKELTK